MKKFSILLSIILLSFAVSCSKQAKEPQKVDNLYQKDSLSFTLPVSWLVKDDYVNRDGRFLELDKYVDYKVKSTMAIGILFKKQPSDSILGNQLKQLASYYKEITFKVLEENKTAKLGKFSALLTTYMADDTQAKIYGRIFVIDEAKNPVYVQIVEDSQSPDNLDYDTIFNSIKFTKK